MELEKQRSMYGIGKREEKYLESKRLAFEFKKYGTDSLS